MVLPAIPCVFLAADRPVVAPDGYFPERDVGENEAASTRAVRKAGGLRQACSSEGAGFRFAHPVRDGLPIRIHADEDDLIDRDDRNLLRTSHCMQIDVRPNRTVSMPISMTSPCRAELTKSIADMNFVTRLPRPNWQAA